MSCFQGHVFPFTAIVGQEKMKLSLILNAINPSIGGVLIRGEKGTAKSTVVRALADLLPEIEVASGCRYGCDPHIPELLCDDCREKLAKGEALLIERRNMRVVDLPINATQDRVAGTIDIEYAIKKGEKRFEPGVLAEANRGILYVDEVNLLGDHIVDILLDSAAMGTNQVEREGVSYSHPAHFILVGTMNPEEGELRPQLLDRFGLCVDVEGLEDVEARVEVIRRRLAYEKEPPTFCDKYCIEQKKLSERIIESMRLLPKVEVSDSVLEMIMRISIDLGVDGHRADIVMIKAASTIAAFNGRQSVSEDDIREAAELVYSHRMKKKPFEQKRENEAIREAADKNRRKQEQAGPDEKEQTPPSENSGENSDTKEGGGREEVFDIGAPIHIQPVKPIKDRLMRNNEGKRENTLTDTTSGVYTRSEDLRDGDRDIAFDATIRAAAPYQQLRNKGENAIGIASRDLKKKVRDKKAGSTIVFVVDASGSMGARQRMEAAKGAIMSLLLDAYQRRDRVGMVAFRGERAEILLPPTSSVERAKKSLAELPTGGKTPLAYGLALGIETLMKDMKAHPGAMPILILVTDGKTNVPLRGGKPVDEALDMAKRLTEAHVSTVVFDTENDFIGLGLARSLAEASRAKYYKVDEMHGETIAGLVKKNIK